MPRIGNLSIEREAPIPHTLISPFLSHPLPIIIKDKKMSWVKSLLLQLDLFWSTDYFRYRSEPEYRTLTGGVCSLLLIITLAAVFSSSVIGTLSKQTINWQYSVAQQTDIEFSVTVDTKEPAKFMFAVGINEMDLVTAPRYFDFRLSQESVVGGVASTT